MVYSVHLEGPPLIKIKKVLQQKSCSLAYANDASLQKKVREKAQLKARDLCVWVKECETTGTSHGRGGVMKETGAYPSWTYEAYPRSPTH